LIHACVRSLGSFVTSRTKHKHHGFFVFLCHHAMKHNESTK
jgi:hypothetical protein